MTSRAARHPLVSASSRSKAVPLAKCHLLRQDSVMNAVQCATVTEYNLEKLAGNEACKLDMSTHHHACKSYLQSILPPDTDYLVRSKLQHLDRVPMLYCSTTQKPDVQIIRDQQVVMVIEVHSSPYHETIEKCVMSVIELLRVKRSFDPNITKCIGFAFPKCSSDKSECNQSVVEVKVSWSGMTFAYELKCIGQDAVKATVRDALTAASTYSMRCDESKRFLVQLSRSDLNLFGEGAIQHESSSSILVQHGDLMYKFPEQPEVYWLLGLCNPRPLNFTFEVIGRARFYFVRYPILPHDPLSVQEAKLCLRNLLIVLEHAISEFHQQGFAHQDIRLENICFNSNCEPVLIDLDRSVNISMASVSYGESCMYNCTMDPGQNDWLQLGWLAAWVLCGAQGDYHGREFANLPNDVKEDPFISKLMLEGAYDEGLLVSSRLPLLDTLSSSSVADIINKRPAT